MRKIIVNLLIASMILGGSVYAGSIDITSKQKTIDKARPTVIHYDIVNEIAVIEYQEGSEETVSEETIFFADSNYSKRIEKETDEDNYNDFIKKSSIDFDKVDAWLKSFLTKEE